ncbi:MAG: motility protein A [Calditrichaeota bacterium]|nr:MAG: motility protein A [Calditrichota bacterium]MBL1204012.1 motility protein A [Calditrichota bacterium]NOG43843.1 motility protein A [Calditrichota bacterium]
MELGTVVGLVSGVILVFTTIFLGGEMMSFLDIASFLVVVGGAIAATFVAIPFGDVLSVANITKNAFFGKKIDYVQVIEVVVDLAKKARREGLLAVDKEVNKIENEFLKTGMEMVVDGTEPELIKKVMNTELSYLMDRHSKGQALYTTLGMYSPAFGMIGTLIGLIAMLQNLDDPAAIGPGMAVALITTFYGALIANLVFLPMATKLANMSGSEILEKEMIIEGVLAIQFGEHPNTISRKLLNFIPPKLREGFNGDAKAA